MLAWYRRTGADLPFGDPLRTHEVACEGWYWRLTDASAGVVIVVLIGVNRAPDGVWATVAVAAHPGGFVAAEAVQEAEVSPDGRRIVAGDVLRADGDRVRAAIGGAEVEFELGDHVAWPFRSFGGIGPAQVIPGLTQYWHPWLLDACAHGRARIAGRELRLDGARAYAEKNWGSGGFPAAWWWGQASSFPERDDVTVAFAGGRAGVGPLVTTAGALVVRSGGRVRRIVRPVQRLHVDVGDERWLLRGGGVEVEGHANGVPPHRLPVPLPAQRRNLDGAAAQHLAGELRVKLADGWEGVSSLAGLERGRGRPPAPPPGASR